MQERCKYEIWHNTTSFRDKSGFHSLSRRYVVKHGVEAGCYFSLIGSKMLHMLLDGLYGESLQRNYIESSRATGGHQVYLSLPDVRIGSKSCLQKATMTNMSSYRRYRWR